MSATNNTKPIMEEHGWGVAYYNDALMRCATVEKHLTFGNYKTELLTYQTRRPRLSFDLKKQLYTSELQAHIAAQNWVNGRKEPGDDSIQ